MPNTNDAIAAIDKKIDELENELKSLQKALESLPSVETNLNALKRVRLILTGKSVVDAANNGSANVDRSRKSIGALLVEIMREQSKPLHVDELMPKLGARGCNASRPTVIGTLIRYKQAGKLKKVRPNTYTTA